MVSSKNKIGIFKQARANRITLTLLAFSAGSPEFKAFSILI